MSEFDLLQLMRAGQYLRSSELAESLGVSTRTVRTYIRRLNDLFGGSASIEYRHGLGYTLVVADEEGYERALGRVRGQLSPAFNSDSRVRYLLDDLLSRSDWVTLDTLSSILFVSRATISGELKRVEEKLGLFGLTLERKPHRGIRVSGPELQRRRCLAATTLARETGLGDEAELRERLDTISSLIDEVSSEAGMEISSVVYQNLVVHILVALRRIEEGCYVPLTPEQLSDIRGGTAYEAAEQIARRVGERYGTELPEEEVAYIALHLDGSRILSDEEAFGDSQGGVITDEVWGAVSEMLEAVWNAFRFDLRGDLELRMNLARHIVPLSVRIRYGMRMENPLLEDVKLRYPLAYSMAMESAPILSRTFDGEVSDEEMGYVALSFALAIERARTQPARKNVLVVCASGMGSAHLLEYRILRAFGDHVGRIETCEATRVGSVDFSRFDYVFTTVPLGVTPPVPVCRIPFFFDEGDAREMSSFLEGDTTPSMGRFFSPELFLGRVEAGSRDEVLRLLCRDMRDAGAVPDEFEDLVFRRERTMGTAFGGGIALPHAIEACGERTVAEVALLADPIDWGGTPVQVVLLISFSRDPEPELALFYQCVAQLLSSGDDVATLLERRDYETFITLLTDIETRLTGPEGPARTGI